MDYKSMSLPELKEAAKNLNLKGVSTLRKNELIGVLEAHAEKNNEKKADNKEKKSPEKKVNINKAPAVEKETKAAKEPEVKKENGSEAEKKSAVKRGRPPKKAAETQTAKAEPAKKEESVKKEEPVKKAAPVKKEEPVKSETPVKSENAVKTTTSVKPEAHVKPENVQKPETPQRNRVVMQTTAKPYNQQQGRNYQQNNYRQQGSQQDYRQNNYRQQGGQQDYRQNNYQQDYRQQGNQQEYRQNNYQQDYRQQNNYQQDYRQNNYSQGYQQPAQNQYYQQTQVNPAGNAPETTQTIQLDTGISREGVLEVLKTEGFGFIRCENFLPGEEDVYVSPTQIRKLGLKTGDLLRGNLKLKNPQEKYQGLYSIESINGESVEQAVKRPRFEDLTPEFPHERIHLETPGCTPAMRLVDLISPVGKGQRGMIVSQPKAGKTTLLKQIANAIVKNHPEMHVIILLIDERPEEVTDIKESIIGNQVEVIYSTFDELPENHKRVSEMVIERAKRLVEHKKDVCILLDSITRLARAYNLTVENSGRTLSGGLDPAALHMPKKFFGAARCMREGGSLTILATALVDTGSRMDDVVFEEFKGTGNMELVLDRSLSERRIFPAIDLPKSGTRREDLLLSADEYRACFLMRQALNGAKSEEAIELILNHLRTTKTNEEFVNYILQYGVFGRIQVQ